MNGPAPGTTYLLDVNALIAAIWTDHAHHKPTDQWVSDKAVAVCPLSELGFIRIATNPKGLGASMADARKLLENFLTRHNVAFVSADMPALACHPGSSAAVTGTYLAELASKHQMKLATLDQAISHPAVKVIT